MDDHQAAYYCVLVRPDAQEGIIVGSKVAFSLRTYAQLRKQLREPIGFESTLERATNSVDLFRTQNFATVKSRETKQEERMDIEHALKDPAAEFETPEAVLNDQRLTTDQKKAVLERWKHDARLLADAASENMGGGEPNLLASVTRALASLDD